MNNMVASSSFIVPKGKGKGKGIARDVEKYEVFISFRDEDTRHTFTSHLYNALCINKITTYFGGQDCIQKGSDEISLDQAHLNAIQESKLCVIVFSENYASSPRCLEELVHIFQCKDQNRQLVVPVFYHVDPSHVRRQQGTYEAAFAAHQQRFKVKHWKDALERAANLSGWDSAVIRSESKLVGDIVNDIIKKLSQLASSSDDYQEKGLVGIERRIEQIESLLQMGSSEDAVRILGICGVGGIGKTTLARVIFNRYSSQFESRCFLENVEEQAKKRRLSQLQSKLFSELLEEKNLNMGNSFVKDRDKKKALIVVDAVDDMEQLEYLVGDGDWFGNGSRIIITTRDEQVLHNIEVDGTYKVEELNFDEALELFSSKAFRAFCVPSPSNYMDLSKRVINQAKGIPSLLKHWGYRLYSKSTQVWESELSRQQKKFPIC